MRKTRLVILPGVRSITQIGCLLLFLACPTIAFKGQERRDVDPICTLNELKNWWLPSDGEEVDELKILGQERRHCIDDRPKRSKGTYDFEKRITNNTLSEARNILALRQYSQSRNALKYGQLCEGQRSSERFATTRKEYRANVHNQRMNERRISENLNQRVSRRNILKPNIIVETRLNIDTLKRESRNNIHRSNTNSDVNELTTEQTFRARTLRRNAQRNDRITESSRRQIRADITGRNSRFIPKDVQLERNDAGVAPLNLRRTEHTIRRKDALNEMDNNRLSRDSPKRQTEANLKDNRRETIHKSTDYNTRRQLNLERIEPRNSRKIEERQTYSTNQNNMSRRELDNHNRRSEKTNDHMKTRDNADRGEENALKKQLARNNRSNSRESRESRLTREISGRRNVLTQMDNNRIDARSFERRASAVRSPLGETKQRQLIDQERDTKRENQENAYPRNKRSNSRELNINTIASRESRDSRLTREISRRSNILMQVNNNRIDARSFERRASAVRSSLGEAQQRQVREQERDTKRENQENAFPRNKRSNSREHNINTIESRESRESRLTNERSGRSNVLMRMDSNRIDARSFERRASAVRSRHGETQQSQLIDQERDTERKNQENAFPRNKRSVSRLELHSDSIQSRDSPLDAVRRLDRRYRSDALRAERNDIRRMEPRTDSPQRLSSAEFTENVEYRRIKPNSRSEKALKDDRRNTNSVHRERLDPAVSRQSRLLRERYVEKSQSVRKELMNNNRDHEARSNIAVRSSEKKFREEISTKEDGQTTERRVVDRRNNDVRNTISVSSDRLQFNGIQSRSSSSIDSRRGFNRDRTDLLRRELRRSQNSNPNSVTASSRKDNSENIENRDNRLYIHHRTERVRSDQRSRVLVRNDRSVSRDHLQSNLQKAGFIPQYTPQNRDLEYRQTIRSYDSRAHSIVRPSYRESRDTVLKYNNPDSLMRRESLQRGKRSASREQVQLEEMQAEAPIIRPRRVENERSDSRRNSRNNVHPPESRIYAIDRRNARNYFPEQVHSVRTESRQARSSFTTTGNTSSPRRNYIPLYERSTVENMRASQLRFNENTVNLNNRDIRKDRRETLHMESINGRRLIYDGLQSRDLRSTSERRTETKYQLSKLRSEAKENIGRKVTRKMTTMGSDKQERNGNMASLEFKERTDSTRTPKLGKESTDRSSDAQYRRNPEERTIQRKEEIVSNRIRSGLRENSLERKASRIFRERRSLSSINSRSSTPSLGRATKAYKPMTRVMLAQSRRREETISMRNEQTSAERQLRRFQRNDRKNNLSNTRSRSLDRQQSDETESTPILQQTIRKTQSRRKSTENISHDGADRRVRSDRREVRSTASENVKEQQRNAQRDDRRNDLVRDKRSLSSERLVVHPGPSENSHVERWNQVNPKDRSVSPLRESGNNRRTKLMQHFTILKSERQASDNPLTTNLRNTEKRYFETLQRNSRTNDVLRRQIFDSQERDHERRIQSRSDRLTRSDRNTQIVKRETRRNSSPVYTRTSLNHSRRASMENFEIYKTQEFMNMRRQFESNRYTRTNSRDLRASEETSLIIKRRAGGRTDSDSQRMERRKDVIAIEARTTRDGADNRNARRQEGTVRTFRNNVFITNSRSQTRDSPSLTRNHQRDSRTQQLTVRSPEREIRAIDKVKIESSIARQQDILQNGEQSTRNTKPIVRQDFPKQRRMESLSADQRTVEANNIIRNKKEISEQRIGIHQRRLRLVVNTRRAPSSPLKELRTSDDSREYTQLQTRAPKNIILRERELGLSRRENRREIYRSESRDTQTRTTSEEFPGFRLIQNKGHDSRKPSDFSRRDSRENTKKPETRIESAVRDSRREVLYRESRDASRQPEPRILSSSKTIRMGYRANDNRITRRSLPSHTQENDKSQHISQKPVARRVDNTERSYEQTSNVLTRAAVSQERFAGNRWIEKKSINEAVSRTSFSSFRITNEGLIGGQLSPSDRYSNKNWIQITFSTPLHLTKKWIQDVIHKMESTYWHNHIIQDAFLGVIVIAFSVYTSSYWSKQRDFNYNLLNCRRIFF